MRDTIDMAREAELDELLEQMPRIAKKFKAFEALVRADERKRLEDYFDSMPGYEMFGSTVADEIREMGNT